MRQPKLNFYQDAAGEWRWNLVAPNGKIIAESGEGYKRYSGAVHGATKAAEAFTAIQNQSTSSPV